MNSDDDEEDETAALMRELEKIKKERAEAIGTRVDPIMLDRAYFLEPDSTSTKAYVLLRRALDEVEVAQHLAGLAVLRLHKGEQFFLRRQRQRGRARCRRGPAPRSRSRPSGWARM